MPCRNCVLRGNECTRSREAKRRKPIRIGDPDQAPPDIGVVSEGQASAAAPDPEEMGSSTMSSSDAAMTSSPKMPLTEDSVWEQSSCANMGASSLRPQQECEEIPSPIVVTSTTATQNCRLSQYNQFWIPNQERSDPSSFDTLAINKLLETFFAVWHPRWPVLHHPSFDWQSAPWDLLWVVFITAAKLQWRETNLPSATQDEMAEVLKKEIDQRLQNGLSAGMAAKVDSADLLRMQTFVLYILFVLYFGKDVSFTHANELVVGVIQQLRGSGVLQHHIIHGQTPFGTPARQDQDAWRMVIVTLFIADIYISILRRRPPTLKQQELNFPLPRDKWLAVAGFHADSNRPTDDSWRSVNSIVQQCLEDTGNGPSSSMLHEFEQHLACCAIRPRLWDEELLGSWATTMERCVVLDSDLESPRVLQHAHRRLFWSQNLEEWRSREAQAYWRQGSPSGPQVHIPRSPVETLNYLMNHVSVLEMWSNVPSITKFAESTSALSPQDRETIQSQLRIWASSVDGRLSIWHATQILRLFNDRDEFTVTFNQSRTLEPVVKQAYYYAGLVLWAFCLGRKSCPECVVTADADHQAAHAGRPALELSFLYDPAFYTRWIQKEGRFTFDGVLLCECKKRNILNKIDGTMMFRGSHDAAVRSMSAELLKLRDCGPERG